METSITGLQRLIENTRPNWDVRAAYPVYSKDDGTILFYIKRFESSSIEWQILKQLDHPVFPHIKTYLADKFSEEDCGIRVMFPYRGRSLRDLRNDPEFVQSSFYSIEFLCGVFRRLAEGLDYLHSRQFLIDSNFQYVSHGDLAEQNILMQDIGTSIVASLIDLQNSTSSPDFNAISRERKNDWTGLSNSFGKAISSRLGGILRSGILLVNHNELATKILRSTTEMLVTRENFFNFVDLIEGNAGLLEGACGES